MPEYLHSAVFVAGLCSRNDILYKAGTTMAEKTLKKNLSWTTAGMVLYNFAIWIMSVLILRILGADESGYYAVATSIGNTLYALALFGMRTYLVTDTDNEYTFGEYTAARISAVVLAFVILIIIAFGSGYDSMQRNILILYSVFKLFEAMTELMDCFGQQKLTMDINAKSMILRSIIYTAVFTAVLLAAHSLALGFAVLSVCSALIFFFYNYRRISAIVETDHRLRWNAHTVQIFVKCLPIMIFEMLAALVVALPRLYYERIGRLDALGIYTSIYTMVVFLQLVINVLIYTLAPYMSRSWNSRDRKQFVKYIVILFAGAAAMGAAAEALTYLMGSFAMGIIYGEAGRLYYGYLYLGIISGVTLSFTWIFSQLFVIIGRNYHQLICSGVSTAACWFLSAVMVRASDCNTISTVLILTNLVFMICAAVLLLREGRRNGNSVLR